MGRKKETVLRRAEHCVSRKNIDDDALKVLNRLRRYGHEAYLVGGGVRDLLLERSPKDFDIATAAHPNEIKKLFRNSVLIGRRFRLAHILFRGKVIETSTFRRNPDHVAPEDGEEAQYHRRDNTFGTAEEDALRRDFTVNGLFYDAGTFNVIDHVGGLDDLKKRLIRCIGDPNIRFREDPVRMIRAIRFASRLGFTIERKTYRAILAHRAEIAQASPARLLEELYKLFPYGSGEAAFRLLQKTGLLDELLPEVAEHLKRVRRKNVMLWRYLGALDGGLETFPTPPPPLLLGSVLYDVYQHRLERGEDKPTVQHRDEVAREVLEPVARRFGVPKRVTFCMLHMLTEQYRFESGGRRFSHRRFVRREDFPETLALREIDLRAHGGDTDAVQEWIQLYKEEEQAGNISQRETRRTRKRRSGGRRPSGRKRGGRRNGNRRDGESR